jgi:hypothetical protein
VYLVYLVEQYTGNNRCLLDGFSPAKDAKAEAQLENKNRYLLLILFFYSVMILA